MSSKFSHQREGGRKKKGEEKKWKGGRKTIKKEQMKEEKRKTERHVCYFLRMWILTTGKIKLQSNSDEIRNKKQECSNLLMYF